MVVHGMSPLYGYYTLLWRFSRYPTTIVKHVRSDLWSNWTRSNRKYSKCCQVTGRKYYKVLDKEVGLHNVLYFSLLTFKCVFYKHLYNIYLNNSLCVKCQLCWPYLHTPTRSSTWAYRITTLFVTWRLPSVLLTSLDCHVKCDEIYRRPQIKMPPESPPEFNPTNAR